MKNNNLNRVLCIILLFMLLFAGCGSKKQGSTPQKQSYEEGQDPNKVPTVLEEMEKNIEKLFTALKGPAAAMEEKKTGAGQSSGGSGNQKGSQSQSTATQSTATASQGQTTQQGQGTQQNQGTKQGGGSQKGQTSRQNQGTSQPQGAGAQTLKDPWKTISPLINKLHYQWNSYMPMALKKGAGKPLMDSFSAALNSLTSTVISKNETNTLMAASYAYGYLSDFYALYPTQNSPVLKKIRYYTRNAMLNAMTANWTQADSDTNSLSSTWMLLKNTVSEKEKEAAGTLDLSIQEFEKVLKARSQPLTDIKGRVTMSNIDTLEKSMKKKSGSGGNSSGGSSQQGSSQQGSSQQGSTQQGSTGKGGG